MSRRKWLLVGPFILCILVLAVGAMPRLFGPPDAAAPVEVAARSSSPAPRPTNTPASTRTPRPSATLRPTRTPDLTVAAVFTASARPTEAPLPTQAPVAVIPQGGLRGAMAGLKNVAATLDAGVGSVSYEGQTWSENALITGFVYDFMQRAPAAFRAEPAMDLLFFKVNAPFTDKYGNEQREQAVGFAISRAVAERVNWENIQARQLAGLLEDAEGCSVSLHPALTAAYARWVAGG